MPSAYPGSESSAQVQVDVTSDSNTGYQLWATDTSDTVSFTNPLPATMADYPTQTPAAPTTWAPGVSGASGYGGVTVLSATGGRLAAWGSGSTTLTDYVSNRYLGLLSGTSTLLHEAVAPVAGDQIQLGVRVTPATTSPPGNYSQSITFTALYKP
jgi:hypothetical protein